MPSLSVIARPEEVAHAIIECHSYVTCCRQNLIVFLNLPSTYMGVVMEHFKSLLLAFGKACDAFCGFISSFILATQFYPDVTE